MVGVWLGSFLVPSLASAQIAVSLPDSSGYVSDQLLIPVIVGDVTGQEVTSFDFTVTYDPTVLDVIGVDNAGTLSSNFTVMANTTNADRIIVGGFDADPLSGSGALIFLQVQVVGIGTSSLAFADFQFNEGTPASTTSGGSLTVANRAPVAQGDVVTVPVDVTTDIDVKANDSDPDGHPLTLSLVVSPSSGTAVVNDNGTLSDVSDDVISYTPNTGFSGSDSFSYSVDDGNGGITQASVSITVVTSVDVTVLSGWNTIGLPVDVSANHYLTLFPSAESGTLYNYDGQYTQQSTLQPNIGYWLRFASGVTQTISGTTRENATLDLLAGWNLVSGPTCSVPLSSLSDPGGIILSSVLYTFSGSYVSSSTLEAGVSYWLRTSAAGQVSASCSSAKSGVIADAPPVPEGADEIVFHDGAGMQRSIYVTANQLGDLDRDHYLLPPLPPRGAFDVRFTDDRYVSFDDGTGVRVNLQASTFPVRITLSSGADTPYTVRADGPSALSAVLRPEGSVLITKSDVGGLRFLKGVEDALPQTFSLSQNYPNPFNPSTTINYALPEPAHVTLTIFDALGRAVSVPIDDEEVHAGFHSVEIDGSDLASGVYMYVLDAGEHRAAGRMILMK